MKKLALTRVILAGSLSITFIVVALFVESMWPMSLILSFFAMLTAVVAVTGAGYKMIPAPLSFLIAQVAWILLLLIGAIHTDQEMGIALSTFLPTILLLLYVLIWILDFTYEVEENRWGPSTPFKDEEIHRDR